MRTTAVLAEKVILEGLLCAGGGMRAAAVSLRPDRVHSLLHRHVATRQVRVPLSHATSAQNIPGAIRCLNELFILSDNNQWNSKLILHPKPMSETVSNITQPSETSMLMVGFDYWSCTFPNYVCCIRLYCDFVFPPGRVCSRHTIDTSHNTRFNNWSLLVTPQQADLTALSGLMRDFRLPPQSVVWRMTRTTCGSIYHLVWFHATTSPGWEISWINQFIQKIWRIWFHFLKFAPSDATPPKFPEFLNTNPSQ